MEPKVRAKKPGTADLEILKTCGYITDDSTVAAYHGVPIARVREVRKLMRKPKPKPESTRSPEAGKAIVGEPIWNNDAERKARKDAVEGSAALLAALLKFFENRRRGLSK